MAYLRHRKLRSKLVEHGVINLSHDEGLVRESPLSELKFKVKLNMLLSNSLEDICEPDTRHITEWRVEEGNKGNCQNKRTSINE